MHATSSNMLDREKQLALIARSLEAARQACGSTVLLEGGPGCGKSSMLAASAHLAGNRGFAVLRAAGSRMEQNDSFGLIGQLLEPRLIAATPKECRALLGGPAAAAARVLHVGTNGEDGDGEPPAPGALHHGFYRLVTGLAAARPLLLLLDDLRWADDGTLEFLVYLAKRIEQSPVLVVGTVDPAQHERAQLLLRGQAQTTVATLPALDERGVRRVIRQRLGMPEREFVQAAVDLTGGIPLLVAALCEEANERGLGPTVASVGELYTLAPRRASHALALRLGYVSEEARRLAEAVAVLGDAAATSDAAAVAELEPSECSEAVDALQAAGVLIGEHTLRFCQPLLRSCAYSSLPAAARARLHAAAARTLHRRGAPAVNVSAHLVHGSAPRGAWAVGVLRSAAESADHVLAGACLRCLLEETSAAAERADLLVELGRLELAVGDPEGAGRFAEAAECMPTGNKRADVLELLGLSQWHRGSFETAGGTFARGLAEPGRRQPSLKARLEAGITAAVGLKHLNGAPARAAEISAPDGVSESAALAQRAFELALSASPQQTVADLALTALAGGPSTPVAGALVPFRAEAACALIWVERLEEADAALTAAVEDASEHAAPGSLAVALQERALARFRRGRLRAAEGDARTAAAVMGPTSALPIPHPRLLLSDVLIEQGRPGEALEQLEAVDGDSPEQQPFWLAARARVRLHRGDSGGALGDLLEAGTLLEAGGVRNPAVLLWRSRGAVAAALLHDWPLARRLASEELELASAVGARGGRAAALDARAMAEDGPERLSTLELAAEGLEDAPTVLMRCRVLLDLGMELRRAGRHRDCRVVLRTGLDLAGRCGARTLARRARRELEASGARPRRERTHGVGSLTPREQQVAELGARHLTNREIARELVVSEKTVEWHLSNVYRKLGVACRPALAEVFSPTDYAVDATEVARAMR